MKTQLNISRSLFAATFAFSLAACASAPESILAQDVLLKDISPQKFGLYAAQEQRSSEDEICQTFYSNMIDLVGRPTKTGSEEILGTIFIAALAGGATYGIGALGITNAFAALSLATSTNQIVYEGGKTVLDSQGKVKTDLAPEVEIADAAMRLGCPEPSKSALKLAVIQAKVDSKSERKLAKLRKKNNKLAAKDVVCREGVQSC